MENKEAEKSRSQVYEIGYLVLPSIPEDKVSLVADNIKAVFVKVGGVEVDSEAPFKHPLAYSMSKTVGASKYVVDDAYLGWIKFDLPAEDQVLEGAEHPIEKIKNELEKITELLRFILIKAPRETTFTFAKAKESIAMKEKEEKEIKEAEEAKEEEAPSDDSADGEKVSSQAEEVEVK